MKNILTNKKFYIISAIIIFLFIMSGVYLYEKISIIGNYSILEKKIITNYSKSKFIRKILDNQEICNKSKLEKYIINNYNNFLKMNFDLSESIQIFTKIYEESNNTLINLKKIKAISGNDYRAINSNMNNLNFDKIDNVILKKYNNQTLAEKKYFEGLIAELRFDNNLAEKNYLEAIKLNPNNFKYYNVLGNLYYNKYDFIKAIEVLENGKNTPDFNNRKKREEKFSLLFDLSRTYLTVNNLNEAYKIYTYISINAKDNNDIKNEYFAICGLAEIEIKHGNYEIALDYLKYSLKLASKLNSTEYKMQSLNLLSKTYYKYGDYNKGKKNGLKAIKLAKRIVNLDMIAKASFNVCLNYEYLNKKDLAIIYCKQSLGVNDVLGNILERPDYFIANGYITSFFSGTRNYDSSLSYYTKAYEISKQNDLELLEIESMYGLSESNNTLGDKVKALKYLNDTINFKEKLGIFKEACDFCKYGVIYWGKKDYKNATNYYEAGLTFALQNDNKIALSCLASHLASINFELKNYKLALKYSDLALSVDKKIYKCGHHYIKYQLNWEEKITKEMNGGKK
ncbi:MAG TPA: hypothetical protein VLL98_02135 [Rickettsiales bacterium]|nr:hypothetical protein [Rickettsiales bacterium]